MDRNYVTTGMFYFHIWIFIVKCTCVQLYIVNTVKRLHSGMYNVSVDMC